MIEALLVDFGGVIGTDADEVFVDTLVAAGVAETTAIQYWNRFWPDLKIGSLSTSQMWDVLREEVQGLPNDIAQRYGARIQINEDVLTYFGSFRPALKTGMLANEAAGWFATKIRKGRLHEYFDVVRSSAELHVAKPELLAYHMLCHELDVSPRNTLFIDNMERNVEAFRTLGGQGIVYTDLYSCMEQIDELLADARVVPVVSATYF